MKFGILRSAPTSSATRFNAATLQHLAMEFLVIVAGILVALGVDNWRQEREELRVTNAHLSDLSVEIRHNIWTIDRVQSRALEPKRQALETVLRFLHDPDAPVEDPLALLQAFARSSIAATPWLSENQFQALQNSGDLRLLRDQELAGGIADSYAGAEVLFSQVMRIQGAYPSVVNELIPAHLQIEFSQLSVYVPKEIRAPAITDDGDLSNALDAISARRVELLRLARNEAAAATDQWYALTRLKMDFDKILAELAPWDNSLTPDEPQVPSR